MSASSFTRTGPHTTPLADRLWEKIDRRGPDECWPWLASLRTDGYGQITHQGRNLRAHRVAFELTHGVTLAPEDCLLHSCDNAICCNPAHLRIGTRADNADDREQRGHGNQGERNPMAKLTADDATTIRALYGAGGVTHSTLAERFGVARPTISRVLSGEAWA